MNRDETAAESFERALAAFVGIAVGEPHAADRKMFSIVATARGAHTRITAGGFSVLWPHRRTPFTYGPYQVAKAMRCIGTVDPRGLDRMAHVIATLSRLVYRRAS
ncbi:hypothetical protein [Polyangium sorediatum]|uniref:Uncharacterized protein n=1 Tax=Polyangium sorediatum TaxID=889274 RepID=A0ABT6NUK9_9BACT|nr:hypothetical protein [Polyangium sorediatum]MDI1431810.1 hypothetical protein [Polyangium sorediatum]